MEQHAGGGDGVRRRRRRDLLRVKRSMSMACSRAGGGDMLRAKQSRHSVGGGVLRALSTSKT
jgi:hypothetical protein